MFMYRSTLLVLFVLSITLSARGAVVARWSFDEPVGSSTSVDKGPSHLNMMVGSAGQIQSNGKWGNCLRNIGGAGASAGQVGRVANIAGTILETLWQQTNFTIEAWVRFDAAPATNNHIISCGNSVINFPVAGYQDLVGWRWTSADQRMHFMCDKPTGIYDHNRVFPFDIGNWHHIAWVRYSDTNRGYIFFDGVVVDSDPWGGDANGFNAGSNPWFTVLTTSYVGGTQALVGSIDELTLYNTAVYTGGFIPSRPADINPTPTPYPAATPTPATGFPPTPTPVPNIALPTWTDPAAEQNMIHILPEGAVLFAFDEVSIPATVNLSFDFESPLPYKQGVLPLPGGNQSATGFREEGFPGTVLYADGKFRMWYRGIMVGVTDNRQVGHYICYAESDNGIDWVRPNLGLTLWDNPSDAAGPNTNNNICGGTHPTSFDPSVIYEPQDPNPAYRYKMAYQTFRDNGHDLTWNLEPWGLTAILTSPDGKNWTEISDDNPIKYKMELSTFFRFKGRYFIGGQQYGVLEPIAPGGMLSQRGFAMWSSHRFDIWPDENVNSFYKPLQFSAENYPRGWDGEQMHLAGCVVPRGNVCLALYGQAHTDLIQQGVRAKGINKVLQGDSTCDISWLISNDGLHFREPAPGFTLMRHSPLNDNFLIQGTGIINVGDYSYIYIDNNKITLMMMRRDGFAYHQVKPSGATYGSFLTEVLHATNKATLHFNIDNVSAQSPINLELVQEVASGYQITTLDPVITPGLRVQARKNGQPLEIAAGTKFRVRARMLPGQKFYCMYASLTGGSNQVANQAWGGYP